MEELKAWIIDKLGTLYEMIEDNNINGAEHYEAIQDHISSLESIQEIVEGM